jgi:hypothetical protein
LNSPLLAEHKDCEKISGSKGACLPKCKGFRGGRQVPAAGKKLTMIVPGRLHSQAGWIS